MDESIDINQSANSNPLVIIIELERRIRQATTTEEIQFIIVNEPVSYTHLTLPTNREV